MTDHVARRGLSEAEAQSRLEQYGPNALPEKPPNPFWQRSKETGCWRKGWSFAGKVTGSGNSSATLNYR